MDALISGRAGVALVIDGDRLFSIHAKEPERSIACQPSEIRFLIGEGKDFLPIEDASREQVVDRLLLAQQCEEALLLALILQDPDLVRDLRCEAAQELDQLLDRQEIVEHVESILYAQPLPKAADLTGAVDFARKATAMKVLARR